MSYKNNYVGKAGAALAYTGYNYYTQQYVDKNTNSTRSDKVSNMGGSTYVSRRNRRTGKVRRRGANEVFKHILGRGSPAVTRWQQTSLNYSGPGRIPIGFISTTTANLSYLPIHFMSLTSLQGVYVDETYPIADVANGFHKDGLCRLLYNDANGSPGVQAMPSQTRVGLQNQDPAGKAQAEQHTSYAGLASDHCTRQFHKYTDIKMNLYGTASTHITYTVQLLQFDDPEYCPDYYPRGSSIAGVDTPFAMMIKDMSRPLIGQNINGNGRQEWSKHVRVVKKEVIKIEPLSYTEAAAELTNSVNTPNIRELRWFIRHDRYRDYDWVETAAETTNDLYMGDLGWDVTKRTLPTGDIDMTKRLYLWITATAPLQNNANSLIYASNTINSFDGGVLSTYDGSYDISVRNAFIISQS